MPGYYFTFWKALLISLELTWPPGPSCGSSRSLGLRPDLWDQTCPGLLSSRERGGVWSRGRNGVSMPFPLALEVHCILSACSVSNINETGFYNQLGGNFMWRNRKTLKFIIYSLENKFVIVLSFLPDINLAVANIKKALGFGSALYKVRAVSSVLEPGSHGHLDEMKTRGHSGSLSFDWRLDEGTGLASPGATSGFCSLWMSP